MKININYIKFLNFKSFRDKRIDFKEQTLICGANATGKTTVFDGFMWCIFGKNSSGKKQFSIKTIDEECNVIPMIPHEVEVSISVDGFEVKLLRRLTEKWKGELFIGNEEERLCNGVLLSVSEWEKNINSLFEVPDMDTLRCAIDPHYLTSLKPDLQRKYLLDIAGGITNEEVCERNPEFSEFLSSIGNKTMDDYFKETQAALKRIVEEKSEVPIRINERERDLTCGIGPVSDISCSRISELKRQVRELSNKEVWLKGVLDTVNEFRIARSRMLNERVNGMFSFAGFKLFDTQVNGEIKETCESTVKGVPYADVNAGWKIIAGIDIASVIQRHFGVSLPLFVDNAESVSSYPEWLLTQFSQVIFLRVTDNQTLTTN